MQGYAIYHEMDYAGRHFERGEYIELELGAQKNDQSLLTIGYLKEHDGKDLLPCLRCGKKFVNNAGELFLRKHEETCQMTEIVVPETASSSGEDGEHEMASPAPPRTLAELSQAAASTQQQGE